jgi:hypothetical protein
MLEAAASDEQVAAWCTEHEKRRRETLREFFEIVLDRTVEDPLLDVLCILTSPDTYTKLATQRGWRRSMWEDAMTEVIHQLAT